MPRKLPAESKREHAVRVLVADAIHDGSGGFHPVGAVIVCPDEEAEQSLKAKGLAE